MRSLDLVAILLTGAISATLASSAAAQAAAPAATAAANPKLLGTWEGPYTTDGPSGTMTVTLAKDGTGFKVTASLGGGEAPAPGEPRDLVIDGDTVTWKQVFGEYDVTFKATLSPDGAQVTGTLEAMQGGSFVGGGSYTLAKK
ncbi:MAG: hypothetical protein EXR94_09685 [Gemmatimonadetes bacterium]|nr:hypothetical protein [Gemmatimonadota bacterium]